MSDREGYYKDLGVETTATDEQIKQAYRKLAMKHHPDKGGDADKMKEVTAAWEVLGDPTNKSEYDAREPSRKDQKDERDKNRVRRAFVIITPEEKLSDTMKNVYIEGQTYQVQIPANIPDGGEIKIDITDTLPAGAIITVGIEGEESLIPGSYMLLPTSDARGGKPDPKGNSGLCPILILSSGSAAEKVEYIYLKQLDASAYIVNETINRELLKEIRSDNVIIEFEESLGKYKLPQQKWAVSGPLNQKIAKLIALQVPGFNNDGEFADKTIKDVGDALYSEYHDGNPPPRSEREKLIQEIARLNSVISSGAVAAHGIADEPEPMSDDSAELADIKTNLESVKAELAETREKLETANVELASIADENSKLKESSSQSEEGVESMSQELEETRGKLKAAEGKLDTKIVELEAERQRRVVATTKAWDAGRPGNADMASTELAGGSRKRRKSRKKKSKKKKSKKKKSKTRRKRR